jgi:hypothetical protein
MARKRGDDARRNGMADVIEATLDRWFTDPFRAAERTKLRVNDFLRTISLRRMAASARLTCLQLAQGSCRGRCA